MPHISIKMLEGRTKEQKKKAVKALTQTLSKEFNVSEDYISVTIEDYTAEQWQEIFKQEITDKQDKLYKAPKYNPKDLL